jgi:lysophospholipase L1-like esterase
MTLVRPFRFLLPLLAFAGLLSGAPLRILPLGDSITQGRGGASPVVSYRYPLWKTLVEAGVDFDFVGSTTTGLDTTPVYPDYLGRSFDRHHEGHWGWTTDQIRDRLAGWLATYDANLVLLFLGTNDAGQGDSAAVVSAQLAEVIALLRADNPRVIVLLGGPSQAWNPFPAYRTAYAQLAARLHTASSPVVYVPQHEGWISDPAASGSDTIDWVHPSAAGDAKLARRWMSALRPFLPLTYGLWRTDHFTPAELLLPLAAPEADPDQDGRPNLVEYLLASAPRRADLAPAPLLEIAQAPGGGLLYRFPVNPLATDIRYRLFGSTDLKNWDTVLFDSLAPSPTWIVSGNRAEVTGSTGVLGKVFVRLVLSVVGADGS